VEGEPLLAWEARAQDRRGDRARKSGRRAARPQAPPGLGPAGDDRLELERWGKGCGLRKQELPDWFIGVEKPLLVEDTFEKVFTMLVGEDAIRCTTGDAHTSVMIYKSAVAYLQEETDEEASFSHV
jgi:hypothetical protein